VSSLRGASGRRGLVTVVVAAVLASCARPAPDVGALDAVYATPAEESQVLSLKRGQTLGELLSTSIEPAEQYDMLLAFRQQASPRRLRPGTEITLRRRREDGWLRRVDVELSRDRTVRLLRDPTGWVSQTIETPTYVDTLYAAGEIENSLWESVVDNPALKNLPVGDRVGLIDDLDRVFQWQMDFSRQIRSGDTYRFVFEEQVRPDGSLRSGKLLAAEMVNAGTSYYAVYFDPNGDGQGSYFDLDGKSVEGLPAQAPHLPPDLVALHAQPVPPDPPQVACPQRDRLRGEHRDPGDGHGRRRGHLPWP